MKTIAFIITLVSLNAFANPPGDVGSAKASSLFVKDGKSLINVEELIQNEVEVQADYGYENFCYKGDSTGVTNKMKSWAKTGYFFSGGGGGFVLKGLKVNRGIVTYDIVMTLEDEVAQGEFVRVLVKPCR